MHATAIVKVQRPLAPPNGPALLYDEARAHMVAVEVGELPEHVRAAIERRPKAYFQARWLHAERRWALAAEVRAQPW